MTAAGPRYVQRCFIPTRELSSSVTDGMPGAGLRSQQQPHAPPSPKKTGCWGVVSLSIVSTMEAPSW